jgi:hypothetical protein
MAKRRKSKAPVIPPAWSSIAERLVMGYAKRRVTGGSVEESGKDAIDDLLQSFLGFRPLADVEEFKKWMEERERATGATSRSREPRKKPWWIVLGVSRDATLADAKRARNKLLLRYHPDRGAGNADKAAEINAAFDEAERELT